MIHWGGVTELAKEPVLKIGGVTPRVGSSPTASANRHQLIPTSNKVFPD